MSTQLLVLTCLGATVVQQVKSDQWTKVMLTDAAKNGAVCLGNHSNDVKSTLTRSLSDGTPGGFYYRQGSVNKWIVFHQVGREVRVGGARFWVGVTLLHK